MSRSFFDAAMSLMKLNDYHTAWITLESSKKILVEHLSTSENICQLRQLLYGTRLDGKEWGEDDSKAIIEEYIASLPKRNLIELLQAVKLKKIEGINHFPPILIKAFRLFTPAINFISTIFNNKEGGVSRLVSNWLHGLQVSNKPDLELNFNEKSRSMKYSSIFVDLAKDNKKYNQLYREIIRNANNEEQILNGLLNYVKSLSEQKLFLEAQSMLSKIEKVLLNGKSLTSKDAIETACLIVKSNLLSALKLTQTRSVSDELDLASSPAEKLKLFKSNKAINIFRQLLDNLAIKEHQLEHHPLTKTQRDQLVEFVIIHKRKVLSFILQTTAFSKEETLNPSAIWLNQTYIDKVGNRHDSYFDFWLTKVPYTITIQDIHPDGLEQTYVSKAHNISNLRLDAHFDWDNNNNQDLPAKDLTSLENDHRGMMIQQFKPSPFKVTDFKKNQIAEKHHAATTAKLVDIGKELSFACATVFALQQEIIKLDSLVDLPQLPDSTAQQALARSKALSDMYLLQKSIVQNIINITKINLELNKNSRTEVTVRNWVLSPADHNVIWQQVQRHLNIYNENDASLRFVKEAFSGCLLQGGLSMPLQDLLACNGPIQEIPQAELFKKLQTHLMRSAAELQQYALEIRNRNGLKIAQAVHSSHQEPLAVHIPY